MQVKSLHLVNFRNFSDTSVDLSRTILISGSNAQGKSNLLESIYFLATTKSPRAEKDIQLVKMGEKVSRVEGNIFTDQNQTEKLEIVMHRVEEEDSLEKRTLLNGLPKRVMDYLGNLVVVYFAPEDIQLITGAPALRRSFLDQTLSQIDKAYKRALSGYSLALMSRNRLLKKIREGEAKYAELEYWSLQLISLGATLTQKRQEFFDFLNSRNSQLNNSPGSFGYLQFDYKKSEINDKRINEYKDKEIAAAATLVGPHRDDFYFLLDDQNLAFFGSRGQQRMAVLDLKLLELEFIQDRYHVTPVLLLDDIFSELDEQRRQQVGDLTQNYQTLLTYVDIETIPESLIKTAQRIKVVEGKLSIT